MIVAEYVWLGGNLELRSKARVLDSYQNINDLPDWNYDGSSTGQASGNDSEVIIKPKAVFKCPFRKGNNILVLSELRMAF